MLSVNVFEDVPLVVVTTGIPIVREPQSKVPEPLIEALVAVVAEFNNDTAPVTVKIAPDATVKPELAADVLLKVTAATAFAGVVFTVTTSPGLIITGSSNPGTPLGNQVLAEFQSVLPVLVRVVCALTKFTNKLTKKTINNKRMFLDCFTDSVVANNEGR
jgi:hypothetical protein